MRIARERGRVHVHIQLLGSTVPGGTKQMQGQLLTACARAGRGQDVDEASACQPTGARRSASETYGTRRQLLMSHDSGPCVTVLIAT